MIGLSSRLCLAFHSRRNRDNSASGHCERVPQCGSMTETIQLGSMGALHKIGQGGQGVVYKAPNVKTVFSRTMVFKEYKKATLASLDVDALKAIPEFLESLPYRDGAKLIDIAAWPCRIVEDRDRVIGFVMPSIPDDFFTDFSTAKGQSRVVAEFQHLLNTPQVLAMRFGGNIITDRQKYELLRKVASSLSFLHERGVCVGDMSPKNMLFSLQGPPSVYFIDCDAMRVKGVSLSQQLETPGWEVPRGEERATVFSDRYKLGLLAMRMILGEQDARDPSRLPNSVPDELRKVIVDTLKRSADKRPTLSEWDLALDRARLSAPAQPTTRPIPIPPNPINPLPPPRPTPTAAVPPAPQPRPQPQPAYPGSPYPPSPYPVGTSPYPVSTPAPKTGSSKAAWLLIPAAVGLLVFLIAAVSNSDTSDTGATRASTSTRSTVTTSTPPDATTTARRTTPSAESTTRPRAMNPERFAAAYGTVGPDPKDIICGMFYLTSRSDWASHAVRGSARTSCSLTQNVLEAYWARFPEPSLDRRRLEVEGSLPCSDVPGALCASGGRLFVMSCVGERNSDGDWITCTGGANARVYLF